MIPRPTGTLVTAATKLQILKVQGSGKQFSMQNFKHERYLQAKTQRRVGGKWSR